MATAVSTLTKLSKQIEHLDGIALSGYIAKRTIEGYVIPDPYSDALQWEENVKLWPSVMYGDIYTYLIRTPGLYTAESLKAYKSLEGYNFFESGHVQSVLYSSVSDDCTACVLKAKVTTSQRVTEKPHEAWVIINKETGYVITGHCTCKAGLEEACSHVAAILFKTERATLFGLNKESRTNVTWSWNQFYRKKVTPQPIAEIDFSVPKRHKKKRVRRPTTDDSDDEEPDVASLFRKLKKIQPNACVLPKHDSETDSASDDEDLPPLMHTCCDFAPGENQSDMKARVLQDFKITQLQARNLEEMTRGQHDSPIWHRQQRGRVTATLAHYIKTLKESTPRNTLVQRVMKPKENNRSSLESMKFRLKNEGNAKTLYETYMSATHQNFKMRNSGLVVATTCPFFAASPDGVRVCDCHGSGLIEVKCSYKHKDKSVIEIDDQQFFLEKNTLLLKKGHRYYTQVQFQMHVCNCTFCDFVVYTSKGIHIQTVVYNPDFTSSLVDKCWKFVKNDLLSEMVKMDGN